VYGGHTFGVDPGKVENATAHVMWQVQDDVIAELGRPWPELVEPSGTSVGVLTPAADSGVACWHLNARPWCAIGQLRGAAAAAGLSIR